MQGHHKTIHTTKVTKKLEKKNCPQEWCIWAKNSMSQLSKMVYHEIVDWAVFKKILLCKWIMTKKFPLKKKFCLLNKKKFLSCKKISFFDFLKKGWTDDFMRYHFGKLRHWAFCPYASLLWAIFFSSYLVTFVLCRGLLCRSFAKLWYKISFILRMNFTLSWVFVIKKLPTFSNAMTPLCYHT